MGKARRGPPGAEPPPPRPGPAPPPGPVPQHRRGGRGGPRRPPTESAGARPEPPAAPAAPLPDGTERRPAAAPGPAGSSPRPARPGLGLPPLSVPHAPARPPPRCPIAATAAQREHAHPLLLPRQARPLGPPPRPQPITARRRHRCAALLVRSAASHLRIRGFPAHRACMSRRGGGGRRNTPPGGR